MLRPDKKVAAYPSLLKFLKNMCLLMFFVIIHSVISLILDVNTQRSKHTQATWISGVKLRMN